jgi:hypothetical protein
MHKLLFTSTLIIAIACTGCSPRSSVFKDAPNDVQFSEPTLVDLPVSASYNEKRKFMDITCDGIEDMIEVWDDAIIGQEYKALVFPGKKSKDGLLIFDEETKYTLTIPLDKSWSSDMIKIDSADVNGDGCGDFSFTEYDQGVTTDTYIAKLAINQGDGKAFVFASDQLKEKVSLEETIERIINAMDSEHDGKAELKNNFAIDWADANNDGRDDLHMFWRDAGDLYITVLYSMKTNNPLTQFSFEHGYDTSIPDFMTGMKGLGNYKAYQLDIEDFNNDGHADIIIYIDSGENITLLPALLNSATQTSYTVQQAHIGKTTDFTWLFSFEKIDHFDANFDGCADNIHVGVIDKYFGSGRKSASIKFSSCK